MAAAPARKRKRFSRTLSPARWKEYGRLLEDAEACGYRIASFEDWLLDPPAREDGRLLLLRHDIDQHPRAALTMSDVELAHGVQSTWYFRWRTADGAVIGELRQRGGAIGLHYETLTRLVLEHGPVAMEQLEPARRTLRQEIHAFQQRFGAVETIAPHGDTRVPGVSNLTLMLGQDPGWFGVRADANVAIRTRTVGLWMTDRSRADGGWDRQLDPRTVLELGTTPVLCLTHPNNWASGPSLWLDRALRAVPVGRPDAPSSRWARTGSDQPLLNDPASSQVRSP